MDYNQIKQKNSFGLLNVAVHNLMKAAVSIPLSVAAKRVHLLEEIQLQG
jgi:hypothetical protein